jgi:hypothetical protein
MLEYLMSVHDIEGFIWKWQRVDIAFFERDVGDTLRGSESTSGFERRGSGFDAGDVTVWDEGGESGGDAAGAAADVEDLRGGLEVWEEVGGTILGSTPGVGAEDGSAMVSDVGLGCHGGCWLFEGCGLEGTIG